MAKADLARTGPTIRCAIYTRNDMGLAASGNLLTIQRDSQIKVFTLAFVVSPGSCSAAWQGIGSITNDMLPNGRTTLSLVQSLRAVGGDVIISFGGANGDEPALHCPDPTTLAAVYQSVINRYEAKALDFDIEGDKVLDQASIQRRNLALVALRGANPGLTLSYTLPVLPSELDGNGVGVLTSAKRDGFNPDVVNVLAMNYGASVDNGGQMGRDALTAASNTALQVKAAGLTSPIGVIPMIGVNDVSPEVFTLVDASLLAAFAASNAYIARLSMWSVSRDNGSCVGSAAAASTCSGIAQSPMPFLRSSRGDSPDPNGRVSPGHRSQPIGPRLIRASRNPARGRLPPGMSTRYRHMKRDGARSF